MPPVNRLEDVPQPRHYRFVEPGYGSHLPFFVVEDEATVEEHRGKIRDGITGARAQEAQSQKADAINLWRDIVRELEARAPSVTRTVLVWQADELPMATRARAWRRRSRR